MTTKIAAIVCALCTPGAAMAAKDCHLDVDDSAGKGMRRIEVTESHGGHRRPGDVTFHFEDHPSMTINALDPPPQPKAGMKGAEAKEILFHEHLHKAAVVHHRRCVASDKKQRR